MLTEKAYFSAIPAIQLAAPLSVSTKLFYGG